MESEQTVMTLNQSSSTAIERPLIFKSSLFLETIPPLRFYPGSCYYYRMDDI